MKKPMQYLKVLGLLSGGGRYSTVDITTKCRVADPRKCISNLRRNGYNVADEWRTTADGNRYKVYYLKLY